MSMPLFVLDWGRADSYIKYLLCPGVHRGAARRGGGSESENKGEFGWSASVLNHQNDNSLKADKYEVLSFMEHNSHGCLAMNRLTVENV